MVSDRLDPRRTHLRRHRARKKIVLDEMPYYCLPWRIFFPFATFDKSLLGYPHSYALEQDYDKFLDRFNDTNPCDAERIASKTWEACVVDSDRYFEKAPEVVELSTTEQERSEYYLTRDHLFATSKTVVSVKSALSKWIQKRHPDRSVPLDLKRVYAHDFQRIVVTDLPFDRWLRSEILGLVAHTNELMHRYHRLQRGDDR